MLTCTFSQDVHSEVSLSNFSLVVILIVGLERLTASLKFLVSSLKVLLLLIKTSLDDLSPSEQTFFQASQGFVLDLDGCFFFQRLG